MIEGVTGGAAQLGVEPGSLCKARRKSPAGLYTFCLFLTDGARSQLQIPLFVSVTTNGKARGGDLDPLDVVDLDRPYMDA